MEHQQHFSHGLLYSVSPEDFQSLHLQDEERMSGFTWEEFKPGIAENQTAKFVISMLKKAAAWCKIHKP